MMQRPYVSRKILALPKRRESFDQMVAQVFVHPVFEGLKIISAGKDGDRERVPVLWSRETLKFVIKII